MYKLNSIYRGLAVMILLVLIFSGGGWDTVHAGQPRVDQLAIAPQLQTVELTEGWSLNSANAVTDDGATISQAGYDIAGWYPTSVPSTVLAALVANGVYQDIYYGLNYNSIPDLTTQNWWYRGEFSVPMDEVGQQYWLRFNGIAYRAEIWLNGTLLDGDAVGTMVHHEYNVTGVIQPAAVNTLAIKVTPPDNRGRRDLSFWYVDWNPAPKDMNAGLWGKVFLDTSGPVELRDPYVKTDLPLPATDSADLTVYVDAVNGTTSPVSGVLKGKIIKDGFPTISFMQHVTLDPLERREIAFDPGMFPQLHVSEPALWWPFGLGSPELYDLKVWFEVDEQLSASQSIKFGVREFTEYLTPDIYGDQYVGFQVNGHNIVVRGSAYVWDMLMRWDTEINEAHMRYIKDMGLNTIRFEGILGNEEIYDIADREGVMLMPGFVCCSQWERWSSWTPENYEVAYASLESQMGLMRHHASALVWSYGSDYAPPTDVLDEYRNIAANLHWQNPTIENANDGNNSTAYVKMDGPYKWEPPNYWYRDTRSGGAFGICAEEGGETPPPEESLRKFIPEQQLWPISYASGSPWRLHAGTSSTFNNNTVFDNGLKNRYGIPTNITEYSDRSQLMAYEAARAQFEAFGANAYSLATGTIFWMNNNAWPSIHWNLYDYFMKPAGSYFGTKKAMEPVHVIWDYNTIPENTSITPNKVKVFNSTLVDYTGMTVSVGVYNIPDLTQQYAEQVTLDVPANVSTDVLTIPQIPDLSTTYFVRLQLTNSVGDLVSSNLYWYSSTPDVLSNSIQWYMRAVTSYADLTGLNALATNNDVTAAAFRQVEGGQETTTIRVDNPSTSDIAFFVRVEVTKGENGEEVLPVTYTDNYITLWPGESATIKARYTTVDLDGQPAHIRVKGYNVPEFTNVVNFFAGFFPPLENLPDLNTAKAGTAIPVKFSLEGDKGLDILAMGYPKSQAISCSSTALVDGNEQASPAGGSSLSYNPVTDQYTYNWKTNKAWAGTCRQLIVKLVDGTYHQVNFQFE